MADHILNPAKALRTLRKTPVILRAVLSDLSPTQAQAPRDGPDGWSALSVVCHLRDYEQIMMQRVRLMLQHEQPVLPIVGNTAPVGQIPYTDQDFAAVLVELTQRRQELLRLLESLSPAQWQRSGIHPEQGLGTILDVAINAGLHDVDHIEQLVSSLAP